jgi:hypothetical protein
MPLMTVRLWFVGVIAITAGLSPGVVRAQSAAPADAVLICEGEVRGSGSLLVTDADGQTLARLYLSCSPHRPRSTEARLSVPSDGVSWTASVTARAAAGEQSCEGEGETFPIRVRCETADGAVVLRAPVRDAPSAEECQVEPLDLAILPSISGTPAAGGTSTNRMALRVLMAAAVPADDGTADAVRAVVREVIACANAGDFPRLFALLSDAYLARYLVATPLESDALQFLEMEPEPLAHDDQAAIIAIEDVRRLPDGRVIATVTHEAGSVHQSVLVVFVEEHGRWRLDAEAPLDPADTPTPAP